MATSNSNMDFCTEMRLKTKKVHDQSDKLINLKLAVVLTDTALYGKVLADFYHVFLAMENAMRVHQEHSHIKELSGFLLVPGILRSSTFATDVEFYLGSDWKGQIVPSAACAEYCERIEMVANNNPELLIAYIHSMYLALLAGGQIIKKIVKRTLGLDGPIGLTIFDFEGISRPALRQDILDTINCLELSRAQKDAIIEEKLHCFRMNNRIANSVQPSLKNFARLYKIIFIFLLLLMVLICLAYLLFIQ